MAKIIDVGIAHKDSGYIWKMGGVLVLLGVCGLGFALICQYVASVASQGLLGTELRRELYHHINTLSHKEVDEFGTALTYNKAYLRYRISCRSLLRC